MMAMAKIKVDPKKCIGCGLCTTIAEECFRLNDAGKAEAICECKEDESCQAKVKEAQKSCPVQAISNE